MWVSADVSRDGDAWLGALHTWSFTQNLGELCPVCFADRARGSARPIGRGGGTDAWVSGTVMLSALLVTFLFRCFYLGARY